MKSPNVCTWFAEYRDGTVFSKGNVAFETLTVTNVDR
jgi:hypothetical protein